MIYDETSKVYMNLVDVWALWSQKPQTEASAKFAWKDSIFTKIYCAWNIQQAYDKTFSRSPEWFFCFPFSPIFIILPSSKLQAKSWKVSRAETSHHLARVSIWNPPPFIIFTPDIALGAPNFSIFLIPAEVITAHLYSSLRAAFFAANVVENFSNLIHIIKINISTSPWHKTESFQSQPPSLTTQK